MGRLARSALAVALGLGACLGGLSACGSSEPVVTPPAAAAGPLYTGPAYLRGTVSSLARIRNFRPLLVSGYGLVTNLNDTGSAGVPAYLRQEIIRQIRRGGFGSAKLGPSYRYQTPERVLADPRTAVVAVYGMIPPGATKGVRFDLLVQALPGTQTTSLAGGTLYMTDLSVGGTNTALAYTTALAKGHGPVYINPAQALVGSDDPGDAAANTAARADAEDDPAADLSADGSGGDGGDDPSDPARGVELARRALVVSGGRVTEDREVEMILNQPSWNRSQIVADRINERFPAAPEDRFQTAEPKNDQSIRLHIPRRFATRPGKLISLIGHLYTQRAPDFEPIQARRLGRVLEDNPQAAKDVIPAWEALGRTVYPVLRDFYDHKDPQVRFAALEAGAWLDDARAGVQLQKIAEADDPILRARSAHALAYLPDSRYGRRALKKLLDDSNPSVRIAAYESLAQTNDPLLDRVAVRDGEGQIKFVIDRVPVEKPMVYVTPADIPRLVIFNPQLTFKAPMLARVWHNRLMVRMASTKKPAQLFYMAPRKTEGKTYNFEPSVATLAYVLGHQPTIKRPQDGLDLSFSQVVDVIYQMCRQGDIEAPVRVRVSPLAASINKARQSEDRTNRERPETGPSAAPATTPGSEAGRRPETTPGLDAAPDQPAGGLNGQRPESSAGRPAGR